MSVRFNVRQMANFRDKSLRMSFVYQRSLLFSIMRN